MNVTEVLDSSVVKWLQEIQRTPLQGAHTRGADNIDALTPGDLHPLKDVLMGSDDRVIDINAGLCLE